MTQWENLPQPLPERPAATSWSAFTADPRLPGNQPLRASDADRDLATRLLEQARVDGRLDAAEQAGRTMEVAQARTLGELAPLVSDLIAAEPQPTPYTARRGPGPGFLRGWVGLAILFNAIWLVTVVSAGHLLYYWPVWPMLGTGIPVLMALMGGAGARDADAYRAARREARAERRQLRRGPGPDLR